MIELLFFVAGMVAAITGGLVTLAAFTLWLLRSQSR